MLTLSQILHNLDNNINVIVSIKYNEYADNGIFIQKSEQYRSDAPHLIAALGAGILNHKAKIVNVGNDTLYIETNP